MAPSAGTSRSVSLIAGSLENGKTQRRKITTRNAAESPLLHLPPEIRNRIYELVLGGKTIHIFWTGVSGHSSAIRLAHRVSRGRDDTSEHDQIPNVRKPLAMIMFVMLFLFTAFNFILHPSSHDTAERTKRRKPFDLNMLQVCHQIHKEAALLALSLTTFEFENTTQLDRFSKGHLFLDQMQAVQSIVILRERDRFDIKGRVVARFVNLTRLEIHGELYVDRVDEHKQFFRSDVLRAMKELPLRDVKIRMTIIERKSYYEIRHVEQLEERIATWAREIEEMLQRGRARPTFHMKLRSGKPFHPQRIWDEEDKVEMRF